MRQDTKNPENNNEVALRARAARLIRQAITPEVKSNIFFVVDNLAFFHHNIDPTAVSYLYHRSKMQISGLITTRFVPEPTSQELLAELPAYDVEPTMSFSEVLEREEVA